MYTLKKSKTLFLHYVRLYRKQKRRLSEETKTTLKDHFSALQEALLKQERVVAAEAAHRLELLAKTALKKTLFDHVRDSVAAIAFALVAAVVIRSLWFEPFAIPTGSMRPTFQEQDHLVVSKTAFGINIPLLAKHLYFDPALVKRNGIVIFTAANLDAPDIDTRYFLIFPGKKQYVKRLIGKPGDTLYFYGGRLYGIDRDGRDISAELSPPFLDRIDHVPYISFDGRSAPTVSVQRPRLPASAVTLRQMNLPVAKLWLTGGNRTQGELLPPYAAKMSDYYQLWGFENYGLSRLLTRDQASKLTDTALNQLQEAPLYLEIFHHPSVKNPVIVKNPSGTLQLSTRTYSTLLPLQTQQLETLFSHLYTARFVVKNETMYRYGGAVKPGEPCFYCPKIQGVPDGTYEFYYGKGYKVLFGGVKKELKPTHPLMRYSPQRIQLLYNLGIECNTYFSPRAKNQRLLPSRYVYFRDGALYAMGSFLLEKGDPTLTRFLEREVLKEHNAVQRRPYPPFTDSGPPLKADHTLDRDKILRYGVTVPDKHYLVLGDNYAMSLDSRAFGFVPEDNLRGVPLFILWPPGPRLGRPLQTSYPMLNLPRSIIWSTAAVIFSISLVCVRKRRKLPIDLDSL